MIVRVSCPCCAVTLELTFESDDVWLSERLAAGDHDEPPPGAASDG